MPQIVPSRALGLADAAAPSNRTTVGLIGTGSHGINRDLNGFLAEQDAQAVAVCDVDSNHRERAQALVEERYAQAMAQGTYKGCAAYRPGEFFREIGSLLERKNSRPWPRDSASRCVQPVYAVGLPGPRRSGFDGRNRRKSFAAKGLE